MRSASRDAGISLRGSVSAFGWHPEGYGGFSMEDIPEGKKMTARRIWKATSEHSLLENDSKTMEARSMLLAPHHLGWIRHLSLHRWLRT